MAAIFSSLLLLLSLCLASATAPPPSHAPATGALHLVCNKTVYPKLCEEALSKLPESSTADPHHLGELMIRVAAAAATNTSTYLATALKKSEAGAGDSDDGADLQQGLTDCTQFFEDAAAQLDDSTAAMDDKRYSEVVRWVLAAMSDAESCKGELVDVTPTAESRMVLMMTGDFAKLCNIVLAITNFVRK